MKIYTGNFANAKKYRENGLVTISIARFARYYSGEKMTELAPPASMIHDKESEYVPKFEKEVLATLNAESVYNKISSITGGKDAILLCYEKAGDFCHRRLVADWLKQNLSIEVEEYKIVKLEPQKALF